MGYTHYGNYFGVTCYDSHVVGVVSIFHVTKKKNHFFLSTFDFAYTHVKKLTKYGNGTYWVFLTMWRLRKFSTLIVQKVIFSLWQYLACLSMENYSPLRVERIMCKNFSNFIIRVRVRVINTNPNKVYGEKDWEFFLFHIWRVHIWGIPL